ETRSDEDRAIQSSRGAEHGRGVVMRGILFHPSKNSTNTGASAFAFTSCVCPASSRYSAFARIFASDCMPLRIHAGLFVPAIASVGTVTEDQRLAGNGLPI